MRKHAILLMRIVSALYLLSALPAMSQSTIFNVPTTDVVSKGNVSFEFDYGVQNPNRGGIDRLDIVTPRMIVGVGGNIEIGANLPIQRNTAAISPFRPIQNVTTSPFIQPNIKWSSVSNRRLGLIASVGSIWLTPLNRQTIDRTRGLIYSNISKKVTAGNYGPRFTIGPYAVVKGAEFWTGSKSGAIVGLEQPIHARAQIVADWFTGRNELGYFTPGIAIALPANSSLSAGYSIGNDSYGNDRSNRFPVVRYKIKL
jgi:hypothetical protein